MRWKKTASKPKQAPLLLLLLNLQQNCFFSDKGAVLLYEQFKKNLYRD